MLENWSEKSAAESSAVLVNKINGYLIQHFKSEGEGISFFYPRNTNFVFEAIFTNLQEPSVCNIIASDMLL